jgi:aspartyl-tRNA(Asn)/glutamyl-tRNA(Gln) amidotransferase subunit A
LRDANAIAAAVRSGRVSAVAVTEACLDRLGSERSTKINAYATVARDAALAAAHAIDEKRAAGSALGPLAGVPVSVKDIVNTAGIRTMWGSRMMETNVPDADAVAVARLKAADAVIIGKTTTPEFAYKLLTDSPVTGVTRNPWNLDRSPGGSSGGAAAAVVAGLGPIALATDAGASTRLPAACCGTLGLKPTLGRIPHNQAPDAFNNFIHLGLMAMTTADLAVALDVVAGPHPSDPYSLHVQAPNAVAALAKGLDLAGKRIAWRPFMGNDALDDEVREHCMGVLDAFRRRGATIVEVTDAVENAEPAWRVLQQSNWAARYFAKIEEVKDRLDPGFVEGIRAGGAYTGQQLLSATYKRTQFYRQVQGWFGQYDFIATPTMSRTALAADHRVDQPIQVNGRVAGDMRVAWAPYLNLFNLTGHPALSVPAGRARDGLPVGLQLVGPWYAEGALLALAAIVEQDSPWTDVVPPYAPE